MIDDEADFGNIIDAPTEEQTAAKFRPKARGKLRKTSLPSKPAPHASVKSTDESVGIVNKDNVSQEHSIHQESASLTCHGCERVGDEEHNNGLSHVATHKESMVISDTQAPATCTIGKTIDDLADFEGDTEKDSHRKGLDDDLCQEHRDKDAITVSDTWPPQDVYATVDLDSHAEMTDPHPDGSWPITGEPSVKATVKFQPYVRRNKGKGKSVSFVPPNVSDAIAPTDTNSEISNFSHLCEDIATGENLNNSPLQAAKKVFPTEAHPDDHEYNDAENQYHEVEPLDHVVDQQPKMDIRETGTSMKLRSREKLQNVGIPEHTADDNMDEDFVEPSSAKQDNDSGDEYTARGKQKVRRKPREKNVNKESSRGTKRTSRNSSTEESLKEKNQKLKSKASSAGQKRASKDSSAEQSEKKLTHRIRQKRMQEVKTLLETPEHEIDRMKLSVTHLRLLQEARERIKGKEIPSGPSSNHSSFQFEEMDDGYNEQENFDDDRTENHVLENATKLNYHSYMNKQTRAKWSKSDTDLFYQGLRQFGSDFAMIQHLFPDKTRNQVRQKFKSEEKKHPMQVHDAIMHRSRDNLYFKKVIKQLNIEDVRPDINNIHEQEGASNEGDPGNKNMLGDFINDEEDNGSNWSDKEQGMHRSEVEEKKNVSTSVDDDLGDVFDWY